MIDLFPKLPYISTHTPVAHLTFGEMKNLCRSVWLEHYTDRESSPECVKIDCLASHGQSW